MQCIFYEQWKKTFKKKKTNDKKYFYFYLSQKSWDVGDLLSCRPNTYMNNYFEKKIRIFYNVYVIVSYTPHLIISLQVMPHTSSHHIISHHITSHNIISQYIIRSGRINSYHCKYSVNESKKYVLLYSTPNLNKIF